MISSAKDIISSSNHKKAYPLDPYIRSGSSHKSRTSHLTPIILNVSKFPRDFFNRLPSTAKRLCSAVPKPSFVQFKAENQNQNACIPAKDLLPEAQVTSFFKEAQQQMITAAGRQSQALSQEKKSIEKDIETSAEASLKDGSKFDPLLCTFSRRIDNCFTRPTTPLKRGNKKVHNDQMVTKGKEKPAGTMRKSFVSKGKAMPTKGKSIEFKQRHLQIENVMQKVIKYRKNSCECIAQGSQTETMTSRKPGSKQNPMAGFYLPKIMPLS